MKIIQDILNGQFDFIFPLRSCLFSIGIGILIFLIRFIIYSYRKRKYNK